jgi:glutamyl/glutaminyl-tRNA synthetase
MHEHVKIYVNDLLKLIKDIIFSEFDFLKDKNQLYHQNDKEKLLEIIDLQRNSLIKIIRHLENFEEHKEFINNNILKKEISNAQEQKRFDDLLKKEDFSILFIVGHFKKFLRVLNSQEKLLSSNQESSESKKFVPKLIKKVKRKTKPTKPW